jgi:signal transduction histidine kinase
MLHQRLPDMRARRSVERILRAAQRAEHLIDDLLDVSAIESGHFSVEKRPFDAAAAVLAAIEMQQGLAAGSSVILASDLAPGLPPIQADGERILEVLEPTMPSWCCGSRIRDLASRRS